MVPVHAVEGAGINVIPNVLSELRASVLDTISNTDIIQINRVGHTGSSGFHRLATPALFAGDVVEGADYLIVDDFIGQGGTLANLRGYIERHGARVIFSSVSCWPESLFPLR